MALWMPYAEEAALDLTQRSVFEERKSHSSSTSCDQPMINGHGYSSLQIGCPTYYPRFSYPKADYIVSTFQISPVSVGSTSSGLDTAVPVTPLSPHFVRSCSTSSPESLASQSFKRSDVDVDALSDDPDFQAFQQDALRVMAERNGGTLLGNNPRMRRAVRSTNQVTADDSYRRQRVKNNCAAKQSRDRRKLREIHLALKVTYLKTEVARLNAELAARVCGRCRQ